MCSHEAATQGKGREEIIQECKGKALYLGKKTPFHLSCSVVPLGCVILPVSWLQGMGTILL